MVMTLRFHTRESPHGAAPGPFSRFFRQFETRAFTNVFSTAHTTVTEEVYTLSMKCDMHVHTRHSGMCTVPLLRRICRESYSDPAAVYDVLKRRGMHLVTITDHDSIDAVESLRKHPDFFLSEEVTCRTPDGTELHMGVYDIEERHHAGLQLRRDDLPGLIAYLREQGLFFSINHVFSGLTGRRTHADFEFFGAHFPAVETLNGQMLSRCNDAAADFAALRRKAVVAGSDAHTLGPAGLTYTEVKGARDRREFMTGLRQARGRPAGASGNYWKLTRTVWEIGRELVREKPLAALLLPLMAAVPLVTLGNVFYETAFAAVWVRRLRAFLPVSTAPARWPSDNKVGEVIP
jgi:predicted metal-dependent phosphoesterase TrpH